MPSVSMIMTASHGFPCVADCLDDFVEVRADTSRFDDQLLDLVLQQPTAVAGTRLWWLGDHRPDPRTDVEPAFLNQVLHHLVGSVGVNLEIRREGADRREFVTRLQDTAQNRARRRKDRSEEHTSELQSQSNLV